MDNLVKEIYLVYLVTLDGGKLIHDKTKFRRFVNNYIHVIKVKYELEK